MISKYKTNTQPLYVWFRGNSLNEEKPTISYVSIEEYGTWLKSGISISKNNTI
jgi:thiol:disulfide interchange protein DsbD